MTDKHYERKSAESGSGSIMALVCILVVSVLVFIFLGYFKMHQVATRMQIAADLASLAGAGRVYDYAISSEDLSAAGNALSVENSPCATAKAVARANGIDLSACVVRNSIVHVRSKRR